MIPQRQKWSGVARAYAETFAGQCAHTVDPLVAGLGADPGTRWLDVGTGSGAVAVAAAARGCVVTGVDPEEDMLALASAAVPGATWVRAGLPRLPFADRSFDVVSANFVLGQVDRPRDAMAELARVLAPGGRVGLAVWPSAPTPLRSLWDEVVADVGVPAPDGEPPRPDAQDFERTPEGLAGLLQDAGLAVVRAWQLEFCHVVDPGTWWSGATRGVARIGQTYLAQSEEGRTAMTSAFHRLSARYLGAEGLLHLDGAAVVAIGVRE